MTLAPCGKTLSAKDNSARLACVRHAASVRPEPGSNPLVKSINSSLSRVHRLLRISQISLVGYLPSLSLCSGFIYHKLLTSLCLYTVHFSMSITALCHLIFHCCVVSFCRFKGQLNHLNTLDLFYQHLFSKLFFEFFRSDLSLTFNNQHFK